MTILKGFPTSLFILGLFAWVTCLGEALFRLREGANLTRSTAVVGAVGGSFTSGKGIDPGGLDK